MDVQEVLLWENKWKAQEIDSADLVGDHHL
jgi:hypothetical protein